MECNDRACMFDIGDMDDEAIDVATEYVRDDNRYMVAIRNRSTNRMIQLFCNSRDDALRFHSIVINMIACDTMPDDGSVVQ